MGFFNSKEKEFKSNGKLFEIILIQSKNIIEDELELRALYRNIESINFTTHSALIKYKDLKVRSPLEVKKLKENLKEEKGLEI